MIGHVTRQSLVSWAETKEAMDKVIHGAKISQSVTPSSNSLPATLPVSENARQAHMHNSPAQRHHDAGSIIASHCTVASADSLASIDRPPDEAEDLPPSKIYRPYSVHVLALLMPASILGALARLGLQTLVTYDGESIFPLAYIQATGCFIMGVALGMKAQFGNL